MRPSEKSSRFVMILSMVIFGTIGILRRYIPYSSSLVAMVRGIIGSVFLLLVILLSKKSFDKSAIRSNLLLLIFSGAAIGFNWIFLFEAYNYTTVATATLCYYLAPIIVILLSPVVLKEKLTLKKILCTAGIGRNGSCIRRFGERCLSKRERKSYDGRYLWTSCRIAVRKRYPYE